MGEEKQFGAVNGRAESESSNPAKIHGWTKSDFTSNGNLKRDYFKSHSYAPTSTLDSDGTLGSSGNESDSSEELHYGPGFVSRLKSRYMSVALRGSTGLYGKSGTGNRKRSNLRRTASLEDFLDQEKNDEQIEIQEAISAPARSTFAKNKTVTTGATAATPRIRPKIAAAATSGVESRASRSKDRTRQETIIKRCQSVEVLSVNDRIPKRSAHPPPTTDNKPPPLPPKSVERPLENILNTTLANDNIVVETTTPEPEVVVPEKKVVQFRKPPPEVSPTSMASLKKPFHKRRSSGLLFGVEERELPAPDTVKETRKIFESIDKSGRPVGVGRVGPSFLTKSQSTSSLYSSTYSNNSRSPSRERNNFTDSKLSRKKSDENLASARRNTSPQRRVSYVNYINNKSSLYRNVPAKVNSKPTLPTKPTNIHFSRRESVDAESNAPTLPAKKNSVISSPVDSSILKKVSTATTTTASATTAASRTPLLDDELLEDGMKVISNDSLKNIRQSGATYSFSFQSDNNINSGSNNNNNNQNVSKSYLPNLSSSPKQVGVIKPITRESDSPVLRLTSGENDNIPRDNHVVIEPEKEVIILRKEDRQTELPTALFRPVVKKASPETVKKVVVTEKSYSPPRMPPAVAPWTTVGAVLKPEEKPEPRHMFPTEPPPPVPASRGVRFSNGTESSGQILTATPAIINTSDSSEDTEDSSFEPPVKEYQVAKEPTVVPPPRPPTTAFHEKSAAHQFLPSATPPATPPRAVPLHVQVEPKPAAPKEEKVTKPQAISPPRSPPTNVSRSDSTTTKSKKSASSSSNSMVFNFVNSDKNVTHIENDGLDMSKRRSKHTRDSGVVIIGGVGESTSTDDFDASDVEEVDHNRPVSPCRITFVGANVIRAKSSLRTKTKTKKLNIKFSPSLPEVFEYPVNEPAVTPPTNGIAVSAPLKTTNNAIGSFGGLGSYTPSKIQGLDNAFQLGVTRTPIRNTSNGNGPSNGNASESESNGEKTSDVIMTSSSESLWPAKDAVSWSGTTSAFTDMLF